MAASLHTRTVHGRVSGRVNGSLLEFRGVPYAAAPIDELRWRPPEAPEPWSFERDCGRYSPIAWQRGGEKNFAKTVINGLGLSRWRALLLRAGVRWAPARESEDCLTLNLTMTADAENLPVMVWFHGGDHSDGAGSQPAYRSRSIPGRGCVLITVNYRLGLFGFLAHPDLGAEADDGRGANLGLLDQISALEWVRDNVGFFGGDPTRVTIFGESAGGQAVLNLMSSPNAKGLFRAAIAQSPGDGGRWIELRSRALRFDAAESAGLEFADAAVGSGSGQLDRMRAMGAADLMQLYRGRPDLGRHFYPVIGGSALPESPYAAFAAGRQASVPFICGYNADEGSVFAEYLNPAGAELGDDPEMSSVLMASHGSQDVVDQLLAAYPGLDERNPEAIRAHLRDHMFGAHVAHVTSCHASQGHRTFRYLFDARPASPRQSIGAFHGAELGPIFDTRLPLIDRGDGFDDIAGDMGDRWVAFAESGVPDREHGLTWPEFGSTSEVLVFDRPGHDYESSRSEPYEQSPGIKVLVDRIERLIGV